VKNLIKKEDYDLKKLIDCAMGRETASLVIKNANLVSVTTDEIVREMDIIIKDEFIVGVGKASKEHINDNTKIIDATGLYVAPGLIDGHIHVESSMSAPTPFAETTIPCGTTAVVSDPHEIGNVLGPRGVKLMLEEGENLPLKFLFEVPSCVPSLPGFETSGATIDADVTNELLKDDRVLGLAEMMNYPGVFTANEEVLAKIKASLQHRKIVEGHAPGLSGDALNAYLAAQVSSDHECETVEEALEKLRKGMHIQIREGSFAKNMRTLICGFKEQNIDLSRCSVVSDDRHPDDLADNGHLDHSLRILVNELGLDPVEALKLVTINPATAINMDDKIGIVAPGLFANVVLFKDLSSFKVAYTIIEGKIIAKEGKMIVSLPEFEYPDWAVNTTKSLSIPAEADIRVKTTVKDKVKVRVIKVMEHSLVTEQETVELAVEEGWVQPNVKGDILPILVIDRHTKSNNIGKGFVTGLGLKKGAIATTVAHDTHQLIVTGTNYEYILKAIKAIKEIRGGYVVVHPEGTVTLPLQYGGIMSIEPIKDVVKNIKKIREQIEHVGTSISEPMMALSFLALPVIPKLKLTDQGLFDGEKFKRVDVIIE